MFAEEADSVSPANSKPNIQSTLFVHRSHVVTQDRPAAIPWRDRSEAIGENDLGASLHRHCTLGKLPIQFSCSSTRIRLGRSRKDAAELQIGVGRPCRPEQVRCDGGTGIRRAGPG